MAVSIYDENTALEASEFTPFDDSRASKIQIAALTTISGTLSGAMNTSEIDPYRQGVEINSEVHRFKSAIPKFWSGNIKNYISLRTYGQALSFTEYKKDVRFNDLLVKFDPVLYIQLGELYPFPLIFNEGPQQNKEAAFFPFTIPFRNGRDTNEAQDVAHMPRGSLEDGNQNVTTLNGHNSIITQFVPYYTKEETTIGSIADLARAAYNKPKEKEQDKFITPFLDEGEVFIGDTVDGGVKIDGYVNGIETKIKPFSDSVTNYIAEQITSGKSTYTYSNFSTILQNTNVLQNNPVFYLSPQPFSSSTELVDQSGNNIVMYKVSSSIYQVPTVVSNSGSILYQGFSEVTSSRNSLLFHSGNGSGVVLSSSSGISQLIITGSVTICFNFKTQHTGTLTNRTVLAFGSSSYTDPGNRILYGIKFHSASVGRYAQFFWGQTDSTSLTSSFTQRKHDYDWMWKPGENKWNHFTFIRESDEQEIYFYVNGTLKETIPIPTYPIAPSGTYGKLSIGAIQNTVNAEVYQDFLGGDSAIVRERSGSISELKIFDRALTSEQVLQEYSSSYEVIGNYDTTIVSDDFYELLHNKTSSLDLDEDIRQNYNQKSSTAGYDVYGSDSGRTGTDSIAYNGWFLGN